MQILWRGREVELVRAPGATDDEVAGVLGVAGDRVPALRRGDVLDAPAPPAAAAAAAALATVGGLDAGRWFGLPACAGLLGGREIDDATVSVPHVEVRPLAAGVGIVDRGSRNGTWVVDPQGGRERALTAGVEAAVGCDASLRIGATVLGVRAPGTAGDRPLPGPGGASAAGTVPFNRPPRPAPPVGPLAPIVVPASAPGRGPITPLGVVALVAPLLMAAAMVVVMRNPVFALFAVLSPVLALGNHVESKRRDRRAGRADRSARAAALAAFKDDLEVAVQTERARLAATAPDLAEVVRRAVQPSTRLWERRPHHDDRLLVRLGAGDVPWSPPLDGSERAADVDAAVARHAVLPSAAVLADLGAVIGVVGRRPAALAVARSLVVQAAVHHGPADLSMVVAGGDDWRWAAWLPHLLDPLDGAPRLSTDRAVLDELAGRRPAFVVVDGDELLAGRRAPLRLALEEAAGVVVAGSVDRLPSVCRVVVVLDGHDGDGEVRWPALGRRQPAHLDGVSASTALTVARALARFDDPEQPGAGAGLPDGARLLDLLELPAPDADAIASRWRAGGTDPPPVAVLGAAADGAVVVDLAADGPHALVAGTTGSGKSELLRTLVAGLAASSSPAHLTFVLVDFKGGAAFDACADLPHVVGLVTDLDAGLAARALRCLEAELRHREGVLRDAGVSDLAGLRRAGLGVDLPRLVVVVDEFATLKAELPDFVDKLVGIAQRGRSLGVHLVLATQRPAGAVSDAIRANTDLRIALRVLDPRDADDVIGAPDAALLPRRRPGRACLRPAGGELVTFQAALVSGRAPASPAPVELRPVPWERSLGIGAMAPDETGGPTDLERLVAACRAAWTGPPPRRPWPAPLPATLSWPGATALADDPDRQRQVLLDWLPADGNLALVGPPGSGATTALLAVARHVLASDVHLYAIDHGTAALGELAGWPSCGAVVGATDLERQRRLVRLLRDEVDERRRSGRRTPAIVTLVDGVGALLAAFDDVAGLEVLDAIARIWSDGPALGIHVAATMDRLAALPAALAATTVQRWTFGSPPGRFVAEPSGLTAQVALPAGDVPTVVPEEAPRPIGALPVDVRVGLPASLDGRPWRVPIGIADDDLGPASLVLWPGDHALVVGPGRSGRTTALATMAGALVAAGADVTVLDRPRSTLRDVHGVRVVAAARDVGRARFLLVDDADGVPDDPALLDLLAGDVHVLAAARADGLRGLYGHWTRAVRRSRLGLLLQPDVDLDGELLGSILPRRLPLARWPGRGFLVVDGAASVVQVGRP